jgi:hypothetical protein
MKSTNLLFEAVRSVLSVADTCMGIFASYFCKGYCLRINLIFNIYGLH